MLKFLTVIVITTVTFLPELPQVKTAGEMRKIMQQGDFSAHISLDTLINKPHIYGLGAAEGIKGELMIMNSEALWCRIENDQMITSANGKVKAAMLVYAQAPEWEKKDINKQITDYTMLEKTVEEYAVQNGLSLDKAFPFIIRGRVEKADWHVIDWKEDVKHTFENHKQFAQFGSFTNEPVTLLGFYSNRHHGIFTHHSSNMHVHVMNENKKIAAHLEEIKINRSSAVISFPLEQD